MHINKYIVVLFISFITLASFARADNRDVVRDTNQHIVKNSFNNCVRTKWETAGDACAPKEVAPVVAIAPEPEVRKPIKRSRSYLVFFDFDKSTLTPSAIDIIKKANAEAHTSISDVSFSITGHADRSGADAYNMKLSQRRANSVKNELVKLDSSNNSIETVAKGESEPLVPTKDGVKEPQNRRVEIIYSIEE